jgi:hypothetical protein
VVTAACSDRKVYRYPVRLAGRIQVKGDLLKHCWLTDGAMVTTAESIVADPNDYQIKLNQIFYFFYQLHNNDIIRCKMKYYISEQNIYTMIITSKSLVMPHYCLALDLSQN